MMTLLAVIGLATALASIILAAALVSLKMGWGSSKPEKLTLKASMKLYQRGLRKFVPCLVDLHGNFKIADDTHYAWMKLAMIEICPLDGRWRVAIWGNDDFGYAFPPSKLADALKMFESINEITDYPDKYLSGVTRAVNEECPRLLSISAARFNSRSSA